MRHNTIAVMASGKGSNLQAILNASVAEQCPLDVRLVLSDKPDAGALAIARAAAVSEVIHLNPHEYTNRAAFDDACADMIEQAECQWIVLAGYMRILSSTFIARFQNRIINIHPSLLPSFAGAHAVSDALEYGVKLTGVTIHLVDEVLDGGSILAQEVVPVRDDDTGVSLLNRIHAVEHQLYPATLQRMIEQGFSIKKRVVMWKAG